MLLYIESMSGPLRTLPSTPSLHRDVMTKPSRPMRSEDLANSQAAPMDSSLIFSKQSSKADPRGHPDALVARLHAAALACEEMVKKVEEGSQVC